MATFGKTTVFSPHIKNGTIQMQNRDCIRIQVIEVPETRVLEVG